MMRREKLLIKLHALLALDIRVDQRSIKLAKEGNPDAIAFPRANIEDAPYDFSFQWIKVCGAELSERMQDEGMKNTTRQISRLLSRKQLPMYWLRKLCMRWKNIRWINLPLQAVWHRIVLFRAAMKEACEKKNG